MKGGWRYKKKRPHGQARQSQLLTTYGPGSMIDLPRWAGVISGLDSWHGAQIYPVDEERLAAKVESALGRRPISLYAPPVEHDDYFTGVPVYAFPRWFVALYEQPRDGTTARPLVPLEMLTPKPRRYLGPDGKKWSVIPVRFVQACVNGHLDDLDWRGFVHKWEGECQKPLWLEEKGTTGDFVDIFVSCECGKRRSLNLVLPRDDHPFPLGYCRGQRPWLGEYSGEKCRTEDDGPVANKLLVRTASHSYFPQVLSVIHIPDRGKELRKAVESVWADHLSDLESLAEVRKERRRPTPRKALEGFSDEDVWEAIQRRKGGRVADPKTIKQTEMETLLAADPEASSDQPQGDFFARALSLPPSPSGPMSVLDRVVLIHRLREVRALVGFSRFEAIVPDINGEYPDVARAEIARETDWVPAVENHGEGFFLSFREDALAEWEERDAVKSRLDKLLEGFEMAKRRKEDFPGPRYVLLHSLSHLLVTAVALECGYAAASVRERIYVTDAGCGILLLTGSAGSEGTLGGLVEVGRRIERHLGVALENGRLCTNDPVCAEHEPSNKHEERFRHGAACHGCLLIAEPSCEKFNYYLDRAFVVPTVKDADCAFFKDLL